MTLHALAVQVKTREAIKQGNKPYYPKKSEKNRQELVRRYEFLKATGKVEKTIAKKAKKNAAKDHRFLPSGRRTS